LDTSIKGATVLMNVKLPRAIVGGDDDDGVRDE
jgi:hypothetical protein